MRETGVQSLGREDPLEKEMATHSTILAWRIPWKEEPGRLQFTGSQKSRTWLSDFTFTFTMLPVAIMRLECQVKMETPGVLYALWTVQTRPFHSVDIRKSLKVFEQLNVTIRLACHLNQGQIEEVPEPKAQSLVPLLLVGPLPPSAASVFLHVLSCSPLRSELSL